MGVLDGQQVSAAVTNPAFLDANADDTALGKISFNNATDPSVSGPQVTNIQRETNSLNSFTGRIAGSVYDVLPAWINTDVGTINDNLKMRADALTAKFNASTGHKHTGAAGDAPPVSAVDIANVPKRGYVLQGTDLTGVTGSSTDVSAQMAGKSPSTGSGVLGVVVNAPVNKIVLRWATGAEQDDAIEDGSGNHVYGRLTESSGVWTLSYFVNLAGTETAYSFTGSNDIRWYYQELFNPLNASAPPPIYSEFALIPSDNATADIITATTTQQGKVQLSSSAAADIASAGTVGTTNASVANADHTHRGVFSVSKSGSAALFGAVTLTGGTGISLTQTGQDITIESTAAAGRAGRTAVANGATSQAVTFSSTLGTTNYAAVCVLTNLTDANPQFQTAIPTAKTATGFTASWNAPTDSANYVLDWIVSVDN